MNTNGKVSPWLFVVILGVVTMLFAVFGLQQQTETQALKEELEKTKVMVQSAVSSAEKQQSLAAEQRKMVEQMVLETNARLEECMKNKKR